MCELKFNPGPPPSLDSTCPITAPPASPASPPVPVCTFAEPDAISITGSYRNPENSGGYVTEAEVQAACIANADAGVVISYATFGPTCLGYWKRSSGWSGHPDGVPRLWFALYDDLDGVPNGSYGCPGACAKAMSCS